MFKRSLPFMVVPVALALLGAAAAGATQFSMTAKYGQKRDSLINIPQVGASPCNHLHRMNVAPIPPLSVTPPVSQWFPFGVYGSSNANPQGCVPGSTTILGPNGGASVFGSNPAGFTIPPNIFSQPLPGSLVVQVVPIPQVQQLASSWAVSGPPVLPLEPLNPLKANGTNTAVWRQFQKSAWLQQSGRAGPNFTACWGFSNMTAPYGTVPSPFGTPCPNITAGTRQMLTKYTGGANRFGGTMSLILTLGPNIGSVALVDIPYPGWVLFNELKGSGSAIGGRGYLETRYGISGSNMFFAGFMASGPGGSLLITALTPTYPMFTTIAPPGHTAQFAWTTGTVLARRHALLGTAASVNTLSAMGTDARTPLGSGAITLVSGGMGASANANSAVLSIMSVQFVPEPSAAIMLVAGSLGLMGLNRLRARGRRRK